ncbi:MAG: hypothetical protein HY716_04555 [Planctomycetes bacterium]|nr:hypothetical protein [Planctomycetota bacterium]
MDIETDVDTFLAGEADRLRVIAFALRGLAGDTGGGGVEAKALHASADDCQESGQLSHSCAGQAEPLLR